MIKLSISNQDFKNYLGQIYPVDIEMKDTTESIASTSQLDLSTADQEG